MLWAFLAIGVVAESATAADAVAEERIAVGASGVLRIAVAGDTGLRTDRIARGIGVVHAKEPLDAILLPGDNFYWRGVQSVDDPQWEIYRPLAALGLPILAALGNHDYSGNIEAQISATGRFPQWRLPARNYAVRSELADIAVIDTTPIVRRAGVVAGGSCEACNAIEETFGRSRDVWRIVVGHHTIISSGWHNYMQRDQTRRMRELLPLMDASDVDLYICGHDHHLELIGGKLPMLISGAGSDPIPPVALHFSTIFPTEIAGFERIGFAVLEITPAALRVRFYDEHGRARSEWLKVTSSRRSSPAASPAP